MNITTLKWLLALSLFTLAMLGGLAPMKFKRKDRYLALGNMWSGGIFLGGGLMHLLPEAQEGLQDVTKSLDSFLATFPCAYFLAALGFFSILLVEEIVLASTHGNSKPDSSNSAEESASPLIVLRSQSSSLPSISRHANHTHIPYTPPTGHLRPVEQNRSFLKLFFTKRTLARSIVQSLTPRSVLVPIDSRSALRRASILSPSTPTHSPYPYADRSNGTQSGTAVLHSTASSANHTTPLLTKEVIIDVPHHHLHNDLTNVTHTHGVHGEKHANDDDDHGGDHEHDHFSIDSSSTVIAYLLVLALSFHSIFEGIALGTQVASTSTVTLFMAIAAHTPLAGFALGVSFVKAKATTRMHVSCITLFSFMTPMGIVTGLLVSYFLSGTTLTGVSSGFQAFSAGTFLFVALEEIIPKELANPRDKAWKLILCVSGFVAMAAIKIFDK